MRICSFIIVMLLCVFSCLFAQAEMSHSRDLKGPDFHFDVVNLADNSQDGKTSQINVYVEVLFDELQFVKVADGYEANYEVSVVILDDDNEQEDGKIWQQRIAAETFDQTNSRELQSITHGIFSLAPGKYKLSVSLLDQESQLSEIQKRDIKAKNFMQAKLSLSEISFTSNIERDSSGVKIRPQVTDPTKGLLDQSYAYFDTYNSGESKNCSVEYLIMGEKSKKTIRRSYIKALDSFRTADYFPIQVDSLDHDVYRLFVTVSNDDGKDKAEKKFFIRWKGLPTNAKDLDEAVEQLKYIATRDEWKKVKNAKGENRIKEFQAFWKRHDPTPESEFNEAMESHYGRVEYTNEHFSVMQREGWRTDMGLLYILLGAPDDIQRNAYPMDQKPYEIWYYYRINRDFIFYDSTGFGDYRFATPYSIYEIQRYANY